MLMQMPVSAGSFLIGLFLDTDVSSKEGSVMSGQARHLVTFVVLVVFVAGNRARSASCWRLWLVLSFVAVSYVKVKEHQVKGHGRCIYI